MLSTLRYIFSLGTREGARRVARRRIHFADENGGNLTETKMIEIISGERINVNRFTARQIAIIEAQSTRKMKEEERENSENADNGEAADLSTGRSNRNHSSKHGSENSATTRVSSQGQKNNYSAGYRGRQFCCSHRGCKNVHTSQGNLNKHATIHGNNPRPFECPLCNKKFRTKDGLQKHQRTHLDAKPYFECATCHKTYATHQSLKLHRRTVHLGKRPFKCGKCEKAFTRKCRLRDHLHTHKKARNARMPYSCKTCSFRASSLDALQKHRKKHRVVQTFSTVSPRPTTLLPRTQ